MNQIDPLSRLPSDTLIKFYYTESGIERSLYAKALILKGKRNSKPFNTIAGHYFLANDLNNEEGIKHTDSIIIISTPLNNSYQPALTYLYRGSYYYSEKKNFLKSLNEYLLGKEVAQKHYNPDLLFTFNYQIGLLKNRIGDYQGSLDLYKEGLYIAKENEDRISTQSKLLAYFGIADSYMNLKKLDSARFYNNLGYIKADSLDNSKFLSYFNMNQTFIDYNDQAKEKSVEKLQTFIPFLENEHDHINLSQTYLYIGNSYKSNGKIKQSLIYYRKIDSLLTSENYLIPETREALSYLLDNARENNNKDEIIHYLGQKSKLDSIASSNSLKLSEGLYKRVYVPGVLKGKNESFKALSHRFENISIFLRVTLSLCIISFLILIIQARKNKIRFSKLLKENSEQRLRLTSISPSVEKSSQSLLTNTVYNNIKVSLDDFIKEEKFLDNNLSLQKLAKMFNTNSKYLSIFINTYEKESYSNFINNLRIIHAIKEIKSNHILQQYTITALANEFGFKNGESFSKAFRKNTGIKPSFFIKELKKTQSIK